MISRRNIRIKVMQTLYALDAQTAPVIDNEDKVVDPTDLKKHMLLLDNKIDEAAHVFAVSMYYIVKLAQYTEVDAGNKAAKYLPTEKDLNVSTKLAGNSLVWNLLENNTFKTYIDEQHLDNIVEHDDIKHLYTELLAKDFYLAYAQNQERTKEEDKSIFWQIWKELLFDSEWFNSLMNEKVEAWEDDKDLVNILIENFKNNKLKVNFLNFISAEKKDYAHELLRTTLEKDAVVKELIQPKLKNWDADRVAQVDMLLLKMGVTEFLYFPTIPTKVTINEYIEIAKTYSTPQSGQFINGVLDNILKSLTEQNKIRKVARP